ncbi:TraV family lipoprotein [Pseudoalteromonas fenneropenaei]|uniref:TraV family lipoprotein n=1 Tax=Pseudoalteromonas fenneropenaei TaxID=1737459 RepID=A0ABV7CNF2_9GAMM
MKALLSSTLLIVSSLGLSGCIASIGQQDFTCNNLKKGGVCAGPRDIYELTNNRESLEGLSEDELHHQVHQHKPQLQTNQPADQSQNYIYEPRSLEQQTSTDYQPSRLITGSVQHAAAPSEFARWPSNGEPMAPEALAVMQEPKPMRIMVNSYTDNKGVFHVPGYLYVNTQKSTWVKSPATDLRPSRVVPLDMVRKSEEQMQRVQQKRQGVDPLGVVTEPQSN